MTRCRQLTTLVLSLAATATLSCGSNDEGAGPSGTPPIPLPGAGTSGRTPTSGDPYPAPAPTPPGGQPAPATPTPGPAEPAPPVVPDDYTWLTRPMPVLWITLDGKAIAAPGRPRAERTLASIKVIQDHDGTPVTTIEGKTIALDAPILMEGRGSSSYGVYGRFEGQRGYGIEFHDGLRNSVGRVLLGLPQNADWALVSCFSDKSCVRNALTYAIGRDLTVPAGRWSPRFRWVEVYFDGAYQGIYTLVEKIKDDKFRVNLPDSPSNAPPSETPYLISAKGDSRSFGFDPINLSQEFLDRRAILSMGLGMQIPGNRRWKFRSPNDVKINSSQKLYLQESFAQMSDALEARTGDWKAFIDVPSFVDYYVISEFTNNVDAFFKSWFMYKMPQSRGGKWFMGPIWDFDLAYGNANYYFRHCATNTQIGPLAKQPPATSAKDDPPPPFAVAPLKDTAVANDLRCRWNTARTTGPLDITRIEARIDAFAAHLRTAKPRDSAKWKNIGVYVWPNNYVGATYEDEIRYLKFWIRTRLAWVDRTMVGQCATTPNPPAVPQVQAPASAMVSRAFEAWGGESLDRFNDYVNILGDMPAQWSCPR